MSKIHYGRGCVYSIKYHLVWCIKYRQNILNDKIDTDVKNIISQIDKDNEVSIIKMETDRNHIHLLIECNPQHYLPNIIKALKGVGPASLLF